MVRIFVRVPGGGRIALLVDPLARVGPMTKHRLDRFAEVWGEDAEMRGPCAFAAPRPLTPMKEALFMQEQMRLGFDEGLLYDACATDEPALPTPLGTGPFVDGLLPMFAADRSPATEPSSQTLKDAIAMATGVPPEQQKVVVRGRGPLDDDDRRLNEFDFQDGTECVLSLKPGTSVGRVGARSHRFLSGPALAHDRQPVHVKTILDRAQKLAKEARSAERATRCKPNLGNKGAPPVLVKPAPDWLRADQGHKFATVMVAPPEWEAQLPKQQRHRFVRTRRSPMATA